MKRLLLIASYSRSILLFRKELLLEFRQRGYEVLAVAPEESRAVIDALAAAGISFRRIPIARTGTNLFTDLNSIRALSRLIREYNPDIAIPYTIKPVLYTLLASFGKRVAVFPMITGVGNWGAEGGGLARRIFTSVLFRVFRLAMKRANGVVFQNNDDLKLFRNRRTIDATTKTIVVNGSGVNLSAYPFVEVGPVQPVRFMLVSRLLKSKGVKLYIDAASALLHMYPGRAVFHLIGQLDPGNPDALEEHVLSKAVDDKVITYHGFCDDVRPLLGTSHVFVLPSYYREGIPRTLLEALATGRPIITTDHVGCRETVVAGENGYLVEPKQLPSLQDAMERFIVQPDKVAPMGKRSRQLAEQRFDVNLVNRDLLHFMNIA